MKTLKTIQAVATIAVITVALTGLGLWAGVADWRLCSASQSAWLCGVSVGTNEYVEQVLNGGIGDLGPGACP